MSTEKMREEFEREWNKVSGRTPERSIAMDGQNSYENRIDDAAWWAWQASRAAIEVDLSTLEVTHDTDTNHEPCGGDLFYADEVRAVIESYGLKIKQ